MVSHRDADKQASRWSDFLSSSVRGSKAFSPLSRPRISLCDEIKKLSLYLLRWGVRKGSHNLIVRKGLCVTKRIFIHSSRRSLFFYRKLEKLSFWQLYLKYRAKPVCPRLNASPFRSFSLINTKKELKTHLTNARRRRAEERGILKGERIAKNSAGRSLFNHQPFCRVLKHLSPLSGASLVRFLPTRARNEHLFEIDWFFVILGEGFEGVLTT